MPGKAGIGPTIEGQCLTDGPIPNHGAVVRIPARTAKVLKEALNVAELDQLR